MCALYLACVSDYIHSCNLRAWQCGSGPAWPTFDISLSFTRAPAKIEWQTNTRCMPCLLIWGFKLSTAGMTLQQHICEYMNMQHVAMRQCACRIRPINFADTVHMCSAWFAEHICISWLLLTQTLIHKRLQSVHTSNKLLNTLLNMCGHELSHTATHECVVNSCCARACWTIQTECKMESTDTSDKFPNSSCCQQALQQHVHSEQEQLLESRAKRDTYEQSVYSSVPWKIWHLVLDWTCYYTGSIDSYGLKAEHSRMYRFWIWYKAIGQLLSIVAKMHIIQLSRPSLYARQLSARYCEL